MNIAGIEMKADFSIGNLISAVLTLISFGVLYGVLTSSLEHNNRNDERQDDAILALSQTLTTLQTTVAEGNGDLRAMRDSMLRVEKQQSEQWRIQLDQWRQDAVNAVNAAKTAPPNGVVP